MTNGRVMLEARKRRVIMEKECQEKKLQKKKLDEMGKEELAIHCFNVWRYKGSIK